MKVLVGVIHKDYRDPWRHHVGQEIHESLWVDVSGKEGTRVDRGMLLELASKQRREIFPASLKILRFVM